MIAHEHYDDDAQTVCHAALQDTTSICLPIETAKVENRSTAAMLVEELFGYLICSYLLFLKLNIFTILSLSHLFTYTHYSRSNVGQSHDSDVQFVFCRF